MKRRRMMMGDVRAVGGSKGTTGRGAAHVQRGGGVALDLLFGLDDGWYVGG
jgi:hypothetical protein